MLGPILAPGHLIAPLNNHGRESSSRPRQKYPFTIITDLRLSLAHYLVSFTLIIMATSASFTTLSLCCYNHPNTSAVCLSACCSDPCCYNHPNTTVLCCLACCTHPYCCARTSSTGTVATMCRASHTILWRHSEPSTDRMFRPISTGSKLGVGEGTISQDVPQEPG